MSVNKIVTKVDGTINKTINFNDLKAGLAVGSHTITVEAWNGATLVSTQTKNITIASSDSTAPTITTATVEDANPNKLVVVFSEVVTITNTTGLTITGAATPTLNAPTGTGSDTVTFTLSTAITNGQSVTLNVDSSNTIKDAANNSLAAATKAITNNVAAVASYETETDSFMTAINIANDSTVHFLGTPKETTGSKWWNDIDQLVVELKSATNTTDLSTVFAAVYPYYGGTADRVKFNLLNPANTDAAKRISHFGSWVHNETGSLVNGVNTYTDTHIVPSNDMALNGNGLIWCFGQENTDTSGIFVHCQNNTTQKIAMYLSGGEWVVSANGINRLSDIGGRKGVWALVKQSSTAAPFFKNKVKVYTHEGGGTLPTNRILECVNSDYVTGDATTNFLGNQTLLSRLYVKSALTDTQIIAVSAALEDFEFRVGRKTW